MLLLNLAPFVAVFAANGWIRILAWIAVAIALTLHIGVNVVMRVSPLYALTHPIGAMLFCYMLLRSTAVTLWHGGVTGPGPFYPLEVPKRGAGCVLACAKLTSCVYLCFFPAQPARK